MVRFRVTALVSALSVGVILAALDRSTFAQAPPQLPLQPPRDAGQSITGAFEGWYQNPDGSYTLLVGYFNRNVKQIMDIPVGPNNRIEPGGPDFGQPTHFQTGRQWGVFVIKVPKDFGTKTLTWYITANGETQSIPLAVKTGYTIEPFEEKGMGNRPPEFTFDGKKFAGPPTDVAATLNGTVGQPVTISFTLTEPKEQKQGSARAQGRGAGGGIGTVSFHKFRGPGTVKFEPARTVVKTQGETVTATASASSA